jgi:hypothetical protein
MGGRLGLGCDTGKTFTDPAAIAAPLANLRSTFISDDGWLSSSREADLVQTLQKHDNWSFKSIDGGHWPMLTIPDELATLLRGLST